MKKITTLIFFWHLIVASSVQAQIFSDSFESYAPGVGLGLQSPDWRASFGNAGGINIATTGNHTPHGSKSIHFLSVTTCGSELSGDILLPFTTSTPLSTGRFTFTSWFKIPAGKCAFFTIQGDSTPRPGNVRHVIDCAMGSNVGDANGSLSAFMTDNNNVCSGTTESIIYPVNTWFELKLKADFTTHTWEFIIDGVSQGSFPNTAYQVWGVNYYPSSESEFWLDDVSYSTEVVGVAELSTTAQASLYPNPAFNSTNISLNLTRQSTVQIAIYAVDGSLAASKEYGQLNGEIELPIDLSKFKSGMYFMNAIIGGKTSVLKLIKE